MGRFIRGGALAAMVALVLLCAAVIPAYALVDINSVGSAQIIDKSVKAIDIAKAAVKAAKIAKGAVRTVHIADGAVTTAKIADNAVTAAKIVDGAGSGLDADMVDGKHAADFVQKTGDQTMAGALTAGGLNYGAAKTGYVSVVGSALAPRVSADVFSVGSGTLWTTTVGDRRFEAPISIPQGAVVTNFRYIAYDNDATYNSQSWLVKRTNIDLGFVDMASAVTVGDSTSWQTIDDASIVDSTIDNSQFAYYLVTSLDGNAGADLKAGMFIVTYTYTSPGS